MKSTSVRGTPYTHIGPGGQGGNEGFRQGGGNADRTVQPQYQGSGLNTQANARGTPARYEHGNVDEFKRVVSSDKYGMVESNQQGNANNPNNNGDGVILDKMSMDYASPANEPAEDSPVPGNAPIFDTGEIISVNQARLGSGVKSEHARDDLLGCGGVMSRGMVQKSTANGPEDELTEDDTLPGLAPAGKA